MVNNREKWVWVWVWARVWKRCAAPKFIGGRERKSGWAVPTPQKRLRVWVSVRPRRMGVSAKKINIRAFVAINTALCGIIIRALVATWNEDTIVNFPSHAMSLQDILRNEIVIFYLCVVPLGHIMQRTIAIQYLIHTFLPMRCPGEHSTKLNPNIQSTSKMMAYCFARQKEFLRYMIAWES